MAGPIRFHEIVYRKSDLLKMPPLDRRYFFMLGQLYNDLSNLLIQVIYHFPMAWSDSNPRALQARRSSAALLTLRHLAARIWEVHSLIGGRFNQFVASYDDGSIKPRVAKLRAYLEGPNAARAIRHSAASHFDQDMIDAGLEAMTEESELRDFFTQSAGNITFDGADTVLLWAMMKSLEEVWADPIEPFPALQKLALELRDAASLAIDMIVPLTAAVYNRHLEDPFKTATVSMLLDQPEFNEISVPVFVYGPNEQKDEAEAVAQAKSRRNDLQYRSGGKSPWQQSVEKG